MSSLKLACIMFASLIFQIDFIQAATLDDSGINVSQDIPQSDYPGNGMCSGMLKDISKLTDVGLTAKDLLEGVPCIAGDFDGNGYLDFVLVKRIKDISGNPTNDDLKMEFLLFKGSHIVISQIVEEKMGLGGFTFEPASDVIQGCDTSIRKTDGIVRDGAGEETVVYFYNSKTMKMERSEYPSEPDACQ